MTVTPQESMRILLIRMHNQREPFTDINVRMQDGNPSPGHLVIARLKG